jgi:glucose-1-phosphate thymidylyltransferase
MKGVILAGNAGSKFEPLTRYTHRHLLPVGKLPMILYPVDKLKECGVTDILIITGKEHFESMVNLLGSGFEYGVEFTYRIQDRPGSIVNSLSLAKHFVGRDRLVVVLGDNIFSANLGKFMAEFQLQASGAKILVKEVPDPCSYAIAEIKEQIVLGIEEKPAAPKSNYGVTGIYLYDSHVFEIIRDLQSSGRDELEITDVNNVYLQEGTLTFGLLDGWWIEARTFESIEQVKQLAQDL